MEGKEKRNHGSWASEGGRSAGLGHTERTLKWGVLEGKASLGLSAGLLTSPQQSAWQMRFPWFCSV